MRKIKQLILEVQRNGLPQYVKQSIEISSNGVINHCLYPMVYLGQMKKYEFKIEDKAVETFFSSIDFDNWKDVNNHYSNSYSYSLKLFYDDNTVSLKSGYINSKMPEQFHTFDDKLLDLVFFIEKPWLFTR